YAARQPGVVVVSMSWDGGEDPTETSLDRHFLTPSGHGGVAFVAASGDSGAPPGYPAISPNVLSVGGTTLTLTTQGNYGSEVGWNGSGGGISAYETQPAYQKGVVTQSTTRRTNPDIAYDADPNLHTVTSGTSFGSPPYSAGPGYNLVTGRGTPIANVLVSTLIGVPVSPPTTATHFSLAASGNAVAGSALSVTVTALDAKNA